MTDNTKKQAAAYRSRAAELRAAAQRMDDPFNIESALRVAKSYESLAAIIGTGPCLN